MTSVGSAQQDFEVVEYSDVPIKQDDLARLRAWLDPTDYVSKSSIFRRCLSSRAPKTARWIVETQEFKRWLKSPHSSSLWIKGAPGAGKSVLAASVIHSLRRTTEDPVLFFFFRRSIAACKSPRALVQDWLEQLLPHSSYVQGRLLAYSNEPLDEYSTEELWECLNAGMQKAERVFCAVDGLDEMEDPDESMVSWLDSLASRKDSNIKLMMTGRPGDYLQRRLKSSTVVRFDHEQALVERDIARFIDAQLVEKELSALDVDEIRRLICKRSSGLFVYGKLLFEQILPMLGRTSMARVRRAIDTFLPKRLMWMYEKILADQRASLGISIDTQEFILAMVTHAARPLRLAEVATALSIRPFARTTMANFKNLARNACGPLLEIQSDETVQVVHPSFIEFLSHDSRPGIVSELAETLSPSGSQSASNRPSSISSTASMWSNAPSRDSKESFPTLADHAAIHRSLARLCLEYLASADVRFNKFCKDAHYPHRYQHSSTQPDETETSPEKTLRETPCIPVQENFDLPSARMALPFVDYALNFVTHHLSFDGVIDNSMYESLDRFFTNMKPHFRIWLSLNWGAPLTEWPQTLVKGAPVASILHVAALCGWEDYLSRLVSEGSDVNVRDSDLRTPLHWAARGGTAKTVSWLLSNGANPRLEDRRGRLPIHESALRSHFDIVQIFCDAGISPETPIGRMNSPSSSSERGRDSNGSSPLDIACDASDEDYLTAVLPSLSTKGLEAVVCVAAANGFNELMQQLLDRDVPVHSTSLGVSALMYAAQSNSVESANILLKRGADPNATSLTLSVPAVTSSDRKVQEKPLVPPLFGALLHSKSHSESDINAMVDLLVAHGANLEARNGEGKTPLLAYLTTGVMLHSNAAIGVVHHLLSKGADPHAFLVDESHALPKYRTALELCCNSLVFDATVLTIVKALLYHGLKPTRSSDGPSIVEQVLKPRTLDSGQISTTDLPIVEAIIEALLNHSASVEASDLLLAAERGCSQQLLSKILAQASGVDDEIILQAAGRAVNLEAVGWLLDTLAAGTDISPALFHMVDTRQHQLLLHIQELQKRGADLEIRNGSGSTPFLHHLTQPTRAMAFLICGSDVKVTTDRGENAIHLLCTHSQSIGMFDYMLGQGVDATAKDDRGNTVLHHLVKSIRHVGLEPPFLERLVKCGVDVDSQNKAGHTFLHLLLMRPDSNTASTLESCLDCFERHNITPNVNLQDDNGLTPFHLVENERGMLRFTSMGADPNMRLRDGRSVLHLACQRRYADLVGFLIRQFPEIKLADQRDRWDRLPLHYACMQGDTESVYYLLKADSHVHAMDKDQARPLHYSCARYGPAVIDEDADSFVELPLEKPARYLPSNDGLSTREDSRQSIDKVGVLRLLLDAGADHSEQDCNGLTPFDWAVKSEQWTLAKELQASYPALESTAPEEATEQCKGPLGSEFSKTLFGLHDGGGAGGHNWSELEAVVKSPQSFLPHLSPSQVADLTAFGADIFGVSLDVEEPSMVERAITLGLIDHLRPLKPLLNKLERLDSQGNYKHNFGISQNPRLAPKPPLLTVACAHQTSRLRCVDFLVREAKVDINAVYKSFGRARRAGSLVLDGEGALHVLATGKASWQVEAMRYLLSRGADPELHNAEGQTPLHVACAQVPHSKRDEHQHLVEAHIERGQENSGSWAEEMVSLLIESGAETDIIDKHGLTCLNKAVNAPRILLKMCRSGASLDLGKFSPLASAIAVVEPESVGILIDSGADIHSPLSIMDTKSIEAIAHDKPMYPLLYACFCVRPKAGASEAHRMVEVIRTLLSQSPRLESRLSQNETLVHFTFEHAAAEFLQPFLEYAKLDIESRDQRSNSILLSACKNSHLCSPTSDAPEMDVLRHLIERRQSDVEAINIDGNNLLHLIIANEGAKDEYVTSLLNYPTIARLVRRANNAGELPLHIALRHGRINTACKLLELGADLMESDPRDGSTALHRLADHIRSGGSPQGQQTQAKLAELMELWSQYLSKGGSIDDQDDAGNSPLFTFLELRDVGHAKAPNADLLSDLLRKLFADADLDVRNNDRETALHIIAKRASAPLGGPPSSQRVDAVLFRLLMDMGVDPLTEDKLGRSSLDVAVACDKQEILKLFKEPQPEFEVA